MPITKPSKSKSKPSLSKNEKPVGSGLLLKQLHKHFGFKAFKEPQEEIINNLLAGKDTFVIMPTGGGKSL